MPLRWPPSFITDSPPVRAWTSFWAARPNAKLLTQFVLAWALLDAMLNVRAPLPDPKLWFLLPSVDVCVLFALFAVLAWAWRRASVRLAERCGERATRGLVWFGKLALWLLAVGFVFVRVFRVGDGFTQAYQSRNVNPFVDLEVLPELVRLVHSALPWYSFALVMLALAWLVPTLVWLCQGALSSAARALSKGPALVAFGSVVLVLAGLSFVDLPRAHPERYQGAFAASLLPRLREDFHSFQEARALRKQRNHRVSAARERLAQSSGDLAELAGANVLLFVIESYGSTVLKHPEHTRRTDTFYADMEQMLEFSGFHFASREFTSPTIGGYSWLAHSTLLTGMKIENQGEYKYVLELMPKTLVHYFAEAGYRTVTAEPATKRPPTGPDFYGYATKFYWKELAYRGRAFSWATMPDQYVIDVIRRRALEPYDGPQFIKYSLVSSHVPWNVQAPVIKDWDSIGNGAIYKKRSPLRYPTTWTDLSKAKWPYLRSILYDLEVIGMFIERFVTDDTMIIIVGDHQAASAVTDAPDDYGVPLHAISRNPELIEKFLRRGYAPSLIPDLSLPPLGMETFPGDFLEDFSSPR